MRSFFYNKFAKCVRFFVNLFVTINALFPMVIVIVLNLIGMINLRNNCFFTCDLMLSGIVAVVLAAAFVGAEPVLYVSVFLTGRFLCIVMLKGMAIRGERGRSIPALWLVCYGITRFLLEFLRGDAYRGFVGALSISQVISLFIMGAGITLMMKNKRIT